MFRIYGMLSRKKQTSLLLLLLVLVFSFLTAAVIYSVSSSRGLSCVWAKVSIRTGMAGVALHRLEVTIRLQELVGGTGVTQTVEHDLLKLRVTKQNSGCVPLRGRGRCFVCR